MGDLTSLSLRDIMCKTGLRVPIAWDVLRIKY